jgi:hypothetical protein
MTQPSQPSVPNPGQRAAPTIFSRRREQKPDGRYIIYYTFGPSLSDATAPPTPIANR